MRWSRFSRFDFDDPDNVCLYIQKRGPLYWILMIAGVFGFLLLFMHVAMDPDWNPGYVRGKGAWLIALMALIPVAVRAVLFACLLALLAECFCRAYYRMYDGRPAFVIGPSGLARLDPWNPCAFGWDEVREIRRELMENQWGKPRPLVLSFITAPGAPPPNVPDWLWSLLPAWFTDRRIDIPASGLDHDEEQLTWLIRRFAGPAIIMDHEIGVLN